MHQIHSVAVAAAAGLVAAFAVPAIAAADTQPLQRVEVRAEGKTQTLFEGPILTRGHDVTADDNTRDGEKPTLTRKCDATNNGGSPVPAPTPTASTADGLTLAGYPTIGADWYDGFEDFFVKRFGPDNQDDSTYAYWGILVNGIYTSVGGCQYPLARDDVANWVYDAFNSRLPLRLDGPSGIGEATSTAEHTPTVAPVKKVFTTGLNQPFKVTVQGNQDDGAGTFTPTPGIGVSPVKTDANGFETVQSSDPATVKSGADGTATLKWSTPGWKRIKADGTYNGQPTIRSNRLDVCVKDAAGNDCGPLPADAQIRGVSLPRFDTASLTLGSAPVGAPSAPKTLTFHNYDSSPVTLGAITASGPDAGDVSFPDDSCSGKTIAPGATCDVSIELTPAATGARRAYVTTTLNGDLATTPTVTVTAAGGSTPPPTTTTGSAGPTGAAGPAGPTGAQGPAGATGAPGASGPKGDPGAQGTKGDTGAQGTAGDAGAKGDAGPAGPSGPKGDTGALVVSGLQVAAQRLDSNGRIPVTLGCPKSGEASCSLVVTGRGYLRLTKHGPMRLRTLGTVSVTMQPGQTTSVLLPISRTYRERLRRLRIGTLRVVVRRAGPPDGNVNSTTAVIRASH